MIPSSSQAQAASCPAKGTRLLCCGACFSDHRRLYDINLVAVRLPQANLTDDHRNFHMCLLDQKQTQGGLGLEATTNKLIRHM